uniref:ubiquitinyl hydrolase 1 n=1 Tax=Kalanchoe fedtschenkoi TaxID=63787 RepID=A0A7N0U3Y3_KALFE
MAESKIYHEKQRLQFCLLHALNNLFQEKDAFTRAKLNAIAEKLVLDDPDKASWTPFSVFFKPHHNAVTGNYDVNVLIAALEEKGKSVVWHDRRNSAVTIDLEEGTLMGMVINVPVKRYGGLWKGRHWVALRRIEGVWYNLDSDFRGPVELKDGGEVQEFLDAVIGGGGEVLLVKNEC